MAARERRGAGCTVLKKMKLRKSKEMKRLDVRPIKRKFANYDKLNEKGVIPENSLYWKMEILLLEKLFLLEKIEMIIQR